MSRGEQASAQDRLEKRLTEAHAAIREWFAAEEAFDTIGIGGFDKPPEWHAARDRCQAAVERLRGVLYDGSPAPGDLDAKAEDDRIEAARLR